MIHAVEISLGGITLELQYLAENMMELTRLTGEDPVSFVDSMVAGQEDKIRRGLQASSPHKLVPLIMAGLVHHDEYAGVDDRTMRRRVCGLLDAEARAQEVSVLILTANIAAKVVPVFRDACIPPGMLADGPGGRSDDVEGAPPSPLDGASGAGTT